MPCWRLIAKASLVLAAPRTDAMWLLPHLHKVGQDARARRQARLLSSSHG